MTSVMFVGSHRLVAILDHKQGSAVLEWISNLRFQSKSFDKAANLGALCKLL